MVEQTFSTARSSTTTFVVVQISPRRWVVAEQVALFLHNPEYRAVTRPFSNRVDAHTVCSELLTQDGSQYSPLTRQHLLDVRAFRGESYLRSHLMHGSDN